MFFLPVDFDKALRCYSFFSFSNKLKSQSFSWGSNALTLVYKHLFITS